MPPDDPARQERLSQGSKKKKSLAGKQKLLGKSGSAIRPLRVTIQETVTSAQY